MCNEAGAGTYTYKTDTIIEILDTGSGYNHRIFQAGKLMSQKQLDSRDSSPCHAAMWVEIGCPTPKQMGFGAYCESGAVKEQFMKLYPGVDINQFVNDKISYHGNKDWINCSGEGSNEVCPGDGCNLQDFVESAKKRGVTIKQVFRDEDCRCSKCRRLGF